MVKVIIGYSMSNKLVKYNTNPEMNKRYPNYSVNMGFGLHVGWAIEVTDFKNILYFNPIKIKIIKGGNWIKF